MHPLQSRNDVEKLIGLTGTISAVLLAGPITDKFGRRGGMVRFCSYLVTKKLTTLQSLGGLIVIIGVFKPLSLSFCR